jgi:hypothetical protein
MKDSLMRIAPFSAPGRFWRGNLHTHSTLSDGALPPERVIEVYRDAGYDFIELSEHFVEQFHWPIADTRRCARPAAWGRATIIDSVGSRAWTNPIWVDE